MSWEFGVGVGAVRAWCSARRGRRALVSLQRRSHARTPKQLAPARQIDSSSKLAALGRSSEHMEAWTTTVRGGGQHNRAALSLHEQEEEATTLVVSSKRINLGYNIPVPGSPRPLDDDSAAQEEGVGAAPAARGG